MRSRHRVGRVESRGTSHQGAVGCCARSPNTARQQQPLVAPGRIGAASSGGSAGAAGRAGATPGRGLSRALNRVAAAAHHSGAAEAHRRDEAVGHRRVAVGAVHLVRRQPGRRWRRPTMDWRRDSARRSFNARGHCSPRRGSMIAWDTRTNRGRGRRRSTVGHRKRTRGEEQ